MVANPEKAGFDTYNHVYTRNPMPHACVERIVLWALQGELEAIATDEGVKRHFQSLIEDTNLDLDTHSILRTMLVFGDAYVRLVKDNKGNLTKLHHLSPRNVEIECDNEGKVTEFITKYGNETIRHSPIDILHFVWQPQKDTPYGTSMMKGLEPLVRKDDEINNSFLRALRGEISDFDSKRNLEQLKAIQATIINHCQVPYGLVTFKIENEVLHSLQMQDFEKMCQSIRDSMRNEIMQKVIEPEAQRKKFGEVPRIGWKRKNRPKSVEETEYIIQRIKLGIISLEEGKELLGLKEYHV